MSRAQLTSTVEQNTGGAVAPFVAGKNAVINGGMDIWQRGTSISAPAAAFAWAGDRWELNPGANMALTLTRQSTNDTTNLPNIQYCARIQRTAGQTGTGLMYMLQNFETVNSIPFAGKTITLSFYARAGANYSAASSALGVQLFSGTGVDQNAFSGYAGTVTVINSTATLTTVWQRFTYTATLNSNISQLGLGFGSNWTGTAGTNDYYEITGVQLELGSVATPFSRANGSIQGELALCQRYYWRMNAAGVQYAPFSTASGTFSTTEADAMIQLPVTMRAAPTTLDYSSVCFSTYPGVAYQLSSLTIFSNGTTKDSVYLYGTIPTAPSSNLPGYYKVYGGSTTAYLGFGAEL